MSVRRNVRLNPYMIQEKNAAEANIVTSIFVTTNSWIFVGNIPADLLKQLQSNMMHADQISIAVMRQVINLFGFVETFANTFNVKGRYNVDNTFCLGMCFWDSNNTFYVTSLKNNRQIQLRYTGNMQPNAQICNLVTV